MNSYVVRVKRRSRDALASEDRLLGAGHTSCLREPMASSCRHHLRIVSALLPFFVISALTPVARAEEASRDRAHLWIDNQGDRRTRVDITSLGTDGGILDLCVPVRGVCTIAVRPGHYRFSVPGTDKIPSRRDDLTVAAGDRYQVAIRPGSKANREGGAALAIAGGLFHAAGLVGLAFYSVRGESIGSNIAGADSRAQIVETVLFTAGGAMLVGGIVMLVSGKTRIDFVELRTR